jgi:hypothetical protein
MLPLALYFDVILKLTLLSNPGMIKPLNGKERYLTVEGLAHGINMMAAFRIFVENGFTVIPIV